MPVLPPVQYIRCQMQSKIRITGFQLIISILLFFFFILPVSVQAAPPEITASAAILMDASTGQIFYAKNVDQKRSPASLTKIMTAILALEYGNLDDVVTVSSRAADIYDGSIIHLHTGDKLTLSNLLKAALIMSANDSTVAIAEHIGGTEEKFIEMMNAKAIVLGALNTRFANTNGYTNPNHYSTAHDLALITKYALNNHQFAQFVGTREAVVEWYNRPRKEAIRNTNRLLHAGYARVDGVKTGSTASAGNCLIASAKQFDLRLITVVLQSGDRYTDTVKLLDYGFRQIEPLDLCKKGEVVKNYPVQGGRLPEVTVITRDNLKVSILRDELPDLERNVTLVVPLQAPVQAGQKLGEATFYLCGQELGRTELIAGQTIPRKSWTKKVRERIFGQVTDKG